MEFVKSIPGMGLYWDRLNIIQPRAQPGISCCLLIQPPPPDDFLQHTFGFDNTENIRKCFHFSLSIVFTFPFFHRPFFHPLFTNTFGIDIKHKKYYKIFRLSPYKYVSTFIYMIDYARFWMNEKKDFCIWSWETLQVS